MMNTKIKILLADDHKVLRDGLRALLESEPDMEVVAEAGTVEETIQCAAKFLPTVIVRDLGMPGVLVIVILIFGVGRISRLGSELGKGLKSFREGLGEKKDGLQDDKAK